MVEPTAEGRHGDFLFPPLAHEGSGVVRLLPKAKRAMEKNGESGIVKDMQTVSTT